MVDALAGQVALGQDRRHIAPEVGLERINREDVDLDAGLDMRALVEAGVEIDIFPIYPLEPDLWRYVPAILAERHLPRERVHHASTTPLSRSLGPARTTGLPP